MGCGRCGKARQGPSCLPLLGKRVEVVPAKAFSPQNALPMCSRWWCQAREGQARCWAPKSRGQSRDLSSSCCSGCELLPTAAGPGAVTVDAASQLGSHPTAWDWTSSSMDVGDVWPGASLQSQNSPTPLPLCLPAWDDSLMDSFWDCLWVTHSSCWWEQNKRSSKAQAETKSRIVYAAEIFSV